MKPKKVLFLITKATWGGAQKYVYDLATHLPKNKFSAQGGPASGWEPIVAYGQPGRLAEKLATSGVETRHIPALGRDIAFISDVSSFFQILVCIWRVRPDIIHLNSSKAAAFGALAARILRVPKIIFTVHGWPFNEQRGPLARATIYYVSMLTAQLSHAVIVVSKSDQAQVEHISRIRQKTYYVPIGIDTIFFPPSDQLHRLTQTIAAFEKPELSNRPRIVTVGELTANKGQSFAIKAVEILKRKDVNVSYTLIGEGEDASELHDLIAELDLADRVNLAMFRPEASKFLRAFDIFLLPSIKEGMPYVLLEAAAAGLPIITTTVVNPEFIGRVKNVHAVAPGDPNAIAGAIQEVLAGRIGKELFPEQNPYPLSEMLEKTIALY